MPCARLLVSQIATSYWPNLRDLSQAETGSPSAFNFKIPCCLIFWAALISGSCSTKQFGQVHFRRDKSKLSIFELQQEQLLLDAYHWSICTKCLPDQAARQKDKPISLSFWYGSVATSLLNPRPTVDELPLIIMSFRKCHKLLYPLAVRYSFKALITTLLRFSLFCFANKTAFL